jgi:hypothetical protein
MLEPASRFSSSSVAASLMFLLLSPAVLAAPLIQPTTILSKGIETSYFGVSVAAHGDTLAVGAPGYAFVELFDRDQGGPNHWGLVAHLETPTSFYDWGFGEDVALSGDTLAVGKTHYPGSSFEPASAYVYERNRGGANSWGEVVKLFPSDPADAPHFGSSVALSGDTLAVGAGFLSSPSPASVYLFERHQGGTDHWGEVRKVTLPGIAGSAISVALRGDTLIVGASQDDGRGTDAGALYVFERNQGGAGQWGLAQKLTASDTAAGHGFGFSVEISGDTIVVGAPGAAAAYIFEGSQGAWSETRKLTISDSDTRFGGVVAIDGDVVLVSAPRRFGGPGSSAYVFRRDLGGPGQWGEAGRLHARSDLQSAAISGNVAVLGNPDWGELFGPEVYIFDLGLLLAQDVPALGPFGLAAMALLLLAAGWRISASRRRALRRAGAGPGAPGPR